LEEEEALDDEPRGDVVEKRLVRIRGEVEVGEYGVKALQQALLFPCRRTDSNRIEPRKTILLIINFGSEIIQVFSVPGIVS